MGQNTGILKQSKKVQITPINVLFVTEYQNLNSGNLLMKGLNSSLALVGNSGPLSSAGKKWIDQIIYTEIKKCRNVNYILFEKKYSLWNKTNFKH